MIINQLQSLQIRKEKVQSTVKTAHCKGIEGLIILHKDRLLMWILRKIRKILGVRTLWLLGE
jgi:hypothetical protein